MALFAFIGREVETPIKYFPVLANRMKRWNSPGFRLQSQTLKKIQHPETAIPAYMSGLAFIFNLMSEEL